MNLKRYDFALIRYIPNPDRGEGINSAVIVRDNKDIVVLWDKDFKPLGDFSSSWNKAEMMEWKSYYEKEFQINSSLLHPTFDKVLEDFWELVRNKVVGPYVLGPTRKYLSNETSIHLVGATLLNDLVKRDRKGRRSQIRMELEQFLSKAGLFDPRTYSYPIQKQYVIKDTKTSNQISFPFAQINGVIHPISTYSTEYGDCEPTKETDQQIGLIYQAMQYHKAQEENGKLLEFLVIIKGLETRDANYRAFERTVGSIAILFLFDMEDERLKLNDYLEKVCVPKEILS